jgi:type VI secretion system protein ImpA
MSAPPLLDLDTLLEPIPGDDPAGSPGAFFELRSQLEEMRREVLNPEDLPEDDPDRRKRADWPGLEKLATETLQKSAKDLRVANYLVLALVRRHGFVGLRDGLRLLNGLVEKCWDRLLPLPDDGEAADRVAPLSALDAPVVGMRLPTVLRSLPLLKDPEKGQAFNVLEWKELQEAQQNPHKANPELQEAFDRTLRATPPDWIAGEEEALTECLAEQAKLAKALNERAGAEAPGFLTVREALEDCQRLARVVLEKTRPARPEGEGKTDIPPDGQGEAPGRSGPVATREEAYRQLARAAETLERLEPHSPIPYLVRRAVELGSLPFPQLIKALIRNGEVLTELSRELGLKESPGE